MKERSLYWPRRVVVPTESPEDTTDQKPQIIGVYEVSPPAGDPNLIHGRRALKTHCKHGHERTAENVSPSGSVCRPCARNRQKTAMTFRARLYGVSRAQYEAMLESQGGMCAICGGPPGVRSLAVDHDHETKRVRGLLCSGCNTGIGGLRENPELLGRAIDYLRCNTQSM